ncbi:hypothetical protein IUJ58_05645 [Priestia aryabhattai]|uniref:hypothetical protein n=1 Tax=Priestia aryabhattai TaxID=412384 RepID=UPI001C0BD36E|nr:hypothetical protein [Priestia aryabhattai]MBU3570583.1 hypothetical protein [Priestia aryabhattai]WDL89740.1 hypothetical protein IUJ58_05645 [Priestia aryabhattai]
MIKNQTRSDFFIMMVNVVSCSCFQLLIGGRGEDSLGGKRLIDRPRKAKPCKEINSGVTSGSTHLS